MQSLELEICVEYLQDLEKAHGHWSFPLLRTLSICVSDGDDHDFTVDIEIFTNSPLLREVSLSKTPTSSFSLPWHQLSKFTGTAYTIDDCLEVLDLIPNLTECAFAAHSVYDAPASRQVTHSNLQSLTLFNDSEVDRSACSADILAYLSLPALQTLEVIDSEADDFDEIFDGFLSRSSPPLRKFTIRLAYATRFYTTSFLHMPKLVDLEIWNPTASFVSDFFDYFDDWDTTFLPELQHLAFLGCRTIMPEIYDMLELLQPSLAGRWRARNRTEFAKKESFRLIWPNWTALNVTEDALRPFQRLIAEGLDVCIEREPN
ncbi:hypothetical protein FB451DRAFT_1267980 [Mycena latifolia]|nr:hypothetical protein FB451DRAFT_1267980 [Mycena latifolia]